MPIFMALALALNSCGLNSDPEIPDAENTDQVYSFTAVLNNVGSRISYEEDPGSHDLKMVWDEADVIWLYPDESMNDPVERYEFVPNTGAGTSHTVFVHQGYIKNWEHWSGKAIYLFPDGDNLEVEVNSEEFLAKSRVQKSNNNTEHLKYAEHRLDEDGNKLYTEYWASILRDANLKHDNKLTFDHSHTIVYKVMLRGFIFDIPGGSELRMSGEAWLDGEVTTLTLGSKDDKEPFLKVGEYGKENYEDKVLTAYIIRQVDDGKVDGSIKKGGKLKFELLTYDKLDGDVIPLDPNDSVRIHNPAYSTDYFKNLPWGDEYTWEVTATADIQYEAGDYVVADLTDTSKDYAYPKVAVDLGLPLKWAAFNVGAKKIDDYGAFAVWGHTELFTSGGGDMPEIFKGEWNSGNPKYDAATFNWGDEWRTPTLNDFLDLVHYAKWLDSEGVEAEPGHDRWAFDLELSSRIYYFETTPERDIKGIKAALVKSKVNDKYIYLHLAGYLRHDGAGSKGKGHFNTSDSKNDRPMMISYYQEGSHGEHPYQFAIVYSDNNQGTIDKLAVSVRAVKAAKPPKEDKEEKEDGPVVQSQMP